MAGVPPAARWTSDAALQSRLLALDPAHIPTTTSAKRSRRGRRRAIMLLHGGVYPVHLLMESFGVPHRHGISGAQIRDPGNGDWSYSPYKQTRSSRARRLVIRARRRAADAGRPQPGRHAGRQGCCKDLAGLVGDAARLQSADGDARGSHDDRRSADRPRAAGGRRLSRIRVGRRRGRPGAASCPDSGRTSTRCARFPTPSTSSPAISSRST